MSTELSKMVETISGLTLLETAKLVELLEEKLGVSAASMMMAGPAAAAAPAAEAAEEQTEFDVTLLEAGTEKIKLIKALREITGLGLKEAKDLSETSGGVIKERVSKKDAEDIKLKLKEVGATVLVK